MTILIIRIIAQLESASGMKILIGEEAGDIMTDIGLATLILMDGIQANITSIIMFAITIITFITMPEQATPITIVISYLRTIIQTIKGAVQAADFPVMEQVVEAARKAAAVQ